ncbi:hypothetical protein COS61_00320 [Candidatus Wolfebacteria bacterium CG03_land_8_20_14_0_80_40_12]|uniref:Adenylate kinase n=1 Tax=Candidatus Wolfebacteria bacterium CG03_land_8_20_14_0_80_40_12 TaxID=1975069 RepID=A0A2M7B683_9BACT|nr:MAG: hypothetical protein COS61_00320 [Candidatus Wolfebacteria bacterium CG03_land_8_20_14_0_80_40_12]
MTAIIIIGPPGSGKGTQAKLLADKLNLFNFDTGSYLRSILYNPRFNNNREIQKERKINEDGKLNTPSWVLKVISQKIKKLSKLDQSVVFSGSPRTLFEAFGDKKHRGLMELLDKECGKNNIYIFVLDIAEQESIKRNSKRSLCSLCNATFLARYQNLKTCPFCGDKIIHRKDDNKNVILIRLKEYKERTRPILKELKKKKYKICRINGKPAPYQIHKKIMRQYA